MIGTLRSRQKSSFLSALQKQQQTHFRTGKTAFNPDEEFVSIGARWSVIFQRSSSAYCHSRVSNAVVFCSYRLRVNGQHVWIMDGREMIQAPYRILPRR